MKPDLTMTLKAFSKFLTHPAAAAWCRGVEPCVEAGRLQQGGRRCASPGAPGGPRRAGEVQASSQQRSAGAGGPCTACQACALLRWPAGARRAAHRQHLNAASQRLILDNVPLPEDIVAEWWSCNLGRSHRSSFLYHWPQAVSLACPVSACCLQAGRPSCRRGAQHRGRGAAECIQPGRGEPAGHSDGLGLCWLYLPGGSPECQLRQQLNVPGVHHVQQHVQTSKSAGIMHKTQHTP